MTRTFSVEKRAIPAAKRRDLLTLGIIAAIGGAPALAAGEKQKPAEESTFDQGAVLRNAEAFFGKGAEGLAKVIVKAFTGE